MKKLVLTGIFALALLGNANTTMARNVEGNQEVKVRRSRRMFEDMNRRYGVGSSIIRRNRTENETGRTKPDSSVISLNRRGIETSDDGIFFGGFNNRERVIIVAKTMRDNAGEVMSSRHPRTLVRAIKYLGRTVDGREALAKGKYVLKNYSVADQIKVEELATKYNFNYVFAN